MGRPGIEPGREDFQSPALPIELSPRNALRQPCAHVARAKTIDEDSIVFIWYLLVLLLITSSNRPARIRTVVLGFGDREADHYLTDPHQQKTGRFHQPGAYV